MVGRDEMSLATSPHSSFSTSTSFKYATAAPRERNLVADTSRPSLLKLSRMSLTGPGMLLSRSLVCVPSVSAALLSASSVRGAEGAAASGREVATSQALVADAGARAQPRSPWRATHRWLAASP